MRRNQWKSGPVLAVFSSLTALTVHAQSQPATTLGQQVSAAGGSSLQVNTGEAVQRVCGNLLNNGNNGAGYADVALDIRLPTSPEEDLFFRCNEMVHNANDLAGAGGTANTLGLSGSELADAMQQLAGEEAASKGRLATETSNGQFANISMRLDAIARGARINTGGLSAAGLYSGTFTGGNAGDEDGESEGWGWFANAGFGFGDRNATLGEDAYDYDSYGLTFGADYPLSANVVLGAALGYSDFEVDFDDYSSGTLASTQAGGGIETDGYSLSVFGLFTPGDRWTMGGVVTLGQNDFETTRIVRYVPGDDATGRGTIAEANRSIFGATDSSQLAAGFNIGTSFFWGATSLYLDGGLSYLDLEIDSYTEVDPTPNGGLNLRFDDQNIDSLQSFVTAQIDRAFSTASGVIIPYFEVTWRHEYSNDAELRRARYANALDQGNSSFDLVFMTDEPDDDFAEVAVGLRFSRGSVFLFTLDYRTAAGLKYADANLLLFSFRGRL